MNIFFVYRLFGTEDVDLRTLSAPSNHLGMGMSSVMPSTPPPPPIISNESESWTKVKVSIRNCNRKVLVNNLQFVHQGVKSNKSSASKSNLDDVRAKLAKAAKGEKYGMSNNNCWIYLFFIFDSVFFPHFLQRKI